MIMSPTFLDELEVISQTAPGWNDATGYAGIGSGSFTSQSEIKSSEAKSRHFKHWAYVAITFINRSFSQHFPKAGIIARGGGRGQLTANQRQWIGGRYPWAVRQSVGANLEPIADDHPFLQLLMNPNPDDSWSEFTFEVSLFLHLMNRCFLWVIPNNIRTPNSPQGLPAQIYAVPPHWVEVKRSKAGSITSYTIRPTSSSLFGGKHSVAPDDMLEIKLKHPRSKSDGYGAMDAAPRWIDLADYIARSRTNTFERGDHPDVYLKLGDKYSDATPAQVSDVKKKFLSGAGGNTGIAKSGGVRVVPPDITIDKASNSPKEMDWESSEIGNRDATLALYSVPTALIVAGKDLNRATLHAARMLFAENNMNPLLTSWACGPLFTLAQRFDERMRPWYPDSTPKSQEDSHNEREQGLTHGAMSPDEWAVETGRAPKNIPATQTAYIPAGRVPIADAFSGGE